MCLLQTLKELVPNEPAAHLKVSTFSVHTLRGCSRSQHTVHPNMHPSHHTLTLPSHHTPLPSHHTLTLPSHCTTLTLPSHHTTPSHSPPPHPHNHPNPLPSSGPPPFSSTRAGQVPRSRPQLPQCCQGSTEGTQRETSTITSTPHTCPSLQLGQQVAPL